MARKQTIEIDVTKEIRDALDYIAERFEMESPEEALAKCVIGFHGRQLALDTHAGKVAKVRDAIRDGKALPGNVKFRRYVSAFTAAKLDAEGTAKEIAKWTHAAPEVARAEIVRERAKPAKESKPAKPAKPAAKGPTVRKAAKPAPADAGGAQVAF